MRSVIIFLLVIVSLSNLNSLAYGQDVEYRDSLFRELEKGSLDTMVLFELGQCININLYNDPDQSMVEARRVLNIAFAASYYSVIPKMLLYQGISYDLNGKYDSAIIMYDSALIMAEKYGFKADQGSIYNNYSIVYSIMGQLEQSLDYCMKALKIFEELGDSSSMAKVYNNLGSRYSEMGMNDMAIIYYKKAIAINERFQDQSRLVKNYGNIGTVYSFLDEHEKALEYYTKAYMITKDLDNKVDMSITLSNMAITYKNMKKFDLALSFAEQSYLIAREANDEIGKLVYFITTAEIFKDQEDFDKALKNYSIAESLADSIGARQNLLEIYSGLADIYAQMGDFRNAYLYKETYNEERMRLLDNEKNKALDKIKEFEDDKVQSEIDILTKDAEIQELVIRRQKIIRNSVAGAGAFILLITILLLHRYRYVRKTRNQLEKKNVIIQDEKEKSDNLLLNILPEETAEELKTKGISKARSFEMVTVLFTDFKGFTSMAEILNPGELVAEIDHCFKAFDNIISNYDIEKIKTIGDAYMCAGGLPVANKTNHVDVVRAAIDIRDFMLKLKENRERKNEPFFEIRIGVHTGPVVAGIVGIKKFQYDIWGDTVNIASRMESSGEVGEVNVSGTTY
ncbi:MAG: tetratricopeptide repeat protein, partial [Bacteroidetes bacterium]|nr:tetratricopeptide repeat protein [Bacteroidota bacterium]